MGKFRAAVETIAWSKNLFEALRGDDCDEVEKIVKASCTRFLQDAKLEYLLLTIVPRCISLYDRTMIA